ncbi:MAG: TrmB family transcriptional regulator [Thermoplasmata archaeon]
MDLKSVISKLGLDADELLAEYQRISSVLTRLGLSEYEARGYVALVALGSGTANLVAEVAQIPRTSAYKVMKSLEVKGFAQAKQGRPRSFAPTEPSELAARAVAEVRESFEKISSVKNILSERGVPQLVYTIMGRERVVDKIGEMLDRTEHTFVLSSPSITGLSGRLRKRFSAAGTRGVRIRIITSPFVKVPKGVEVVRREGLIATDVVSDGKAALLAAPDLSACGYTDNEALAAHIEEFLKVMTESRR